MSVSEFEKLPEKIRKQLRETRYTSTAANRKSVGAIGEIDLELQFKVNIIEDEEVTDKTGNLAIKCTLLVVPCHGGGIVGQDFLKNNRITNEKELQGCRQRSQLIPYVKRRYKFARETKKEPIPIKLNKTVTIKKGKATFAECRTINSGKVEFEKGCLQPTHEHNEKGVYITRSLVEIEKPEVLISNYTNKPYKLKKGTIMGWVEPTEELIPIHNIKLTEEDANSKLMQIPENEEWELPEHMQHLMQDLPPEINPKQRQQVKEMLYQYQRAFMGPDGDYGETDLLEHTIDIGEAKPVKQRAYTNRKHQEIIDEKTDDLLKRGKIEPSASPWASPVLLAPKPNGQWRFCVDYRKLNSVTKKDSFPLPRVNDLFSELSGNQYFSSLDLANGYWQVPMAKEDKEKTAFVTRKGLWQFKYMPFGLANAPATFERLMGLLLAGLRWEHCLVYLDDVLVTGSSFDNHLDNLKIILKRFLDGNLTLKASKCDLFKHSIEYLGHLVSREGVECLESKIHTIQEWPTPRNAKDVQSFLGLANYYRKFVENFSEIEAPMRNLTRKKVTFQWTEVEEEAFNTLKKKLSEPPILTMPTRDDKFILDTDASATGIGAVLSQVQNGEEKVITYDSQIMKESQQNYCTTRRELLACVHFVQKHKQYLYGRHFVLRTDHNPLKWLVNFKKPEGILARWLMDLYMFDFVIEYRPGKNHGNSDANSRRGKCKGQNCPCESETRPITQIGKQYRLTDLLEGGGPNQEPPREDLTNINIDNIITEREEPLLTSILIDLPISVTTEKHSYPVTIEEKKEKVKPTEQSEPSTYGDQGKPLHIMQTVIEEEEPSEENYFTAEEEETQPPTLTVPPVLTSPSPTSSQPKDRQSCE